MQTPSGLPEFMSHNILDSQPRVLDITDWTESSSHYEDTIVEPVSATLGGHVRGLRLSKTPVSDELKGFLSEQLRRRGFLYFEPGTVDASSFVDLISWFGNARYLGTPYTPKSNVSGTVNTIDSATKKTLANYIWHTDQAYRPEPTRFTALFGEIIPDVGGDTIFANATAAYDLLDPLLAQYLETLTAIQNYDAQGFLTYAYGHNPEALAAQRALFPPIETPVIREHPDTGRKQIFVTELYTTRIVGLTPVASQSLLNLLFDVIKSPEIHARVRWAEGAALIWDNRSVQHRGVNDFGQKRRLLHRAVIS